MLQFWGVYILEGLIHGGAYFRNFTVVLHGMLLVETDYFVYNFCTGLRFWLA